MDLRHLRYFVALAEELHFARAAERLGIDQSPLSRAIKTLERDIGATLFARTSRSTRITAAGEVFLEDARRILADIDSARSSARAAAAGSAGRLRIGISPSIAQPRLSRLIAQTRSEEPALDLHSADLVASEQARALLLGALDIAISPMAIDADGVRSEALWTSPVVAVLPLDHALAAAPHIRLSDILREGYAVSHQELCLACSDLSGAMQAEGRSSTEVPSAGSVSMLLERVASGLTVGLVLADQVEAVQRSDVVIRALADRNQPSITTYLLIRGAIVSTVVARFIRRARMLP